MTTSHESFYSGIDSALTPEQALQALALEGTGDTSTATVPDAGGAPTTTTATDDKGAAKADTDNEQEQPAQGKADDGKTVDVSATEVDESQIDPSKAVVLAKDGKHTIPYAKLEEARKGAQQWQAAAEAAQQQLADLQAQAQARADAGQAPTKTDNMAATAAAAIEAGADADLFGDFSEEALKAGIEKLVAQQVATQVQAHVAKAVEPLQAKHQQDAASSHFDAIYKAHPNADSIVQSSEFQAWVDSHQRGPRRVPGTVRRENGRQRGPDRGGVRRIQGGDRETLVSTSCGRPQGRSASRSLAKAKADPPSSLSSIPGGHAAGASALDATADMSGLEMLQATANMSPAQIEAWLNKQI